MRCIENGYMALVVELQPALSLPLTQHNALASGDKSRIKWSLSFVLLEQNISRRHGFILGTEGPFAGRNGKKHRVSNIPRKLSRMNYWS